MFTITHAEASETDGVQREAPLSTDVYIDIPLNQHFRMGEEMTVLVDISKWEP